MGDTADAIDPERQENVYCRNSEECSFVSVYEDTPVLVTGGREKLLPVVSQFLNDNVVTNTETPKPFTENA